MQPLDLIICLVLSILVHLSLVHSHKSLYAISLTPFSVFKTCKYYRIREAKTVLIDAPILNKLYSNIYGQSTQLMVKLENIHNLQKYSSNENCEIHIYSSVLSDKYYYWVWENLLEWSAMAKPWLFFLKQLAYSKKNINFLSLLTYSSRTKK